MFKDQDHQNTSANNSGTLGSNPVFYLIYFGFYFLPWFFVEPTWQDVAAITLALLLFLPIYWHASYRVNQHKPSAGIYHAAAMSAIGFAVASFNGAHGVFHIYSLVQAGFVRPERRAWITIIALSIAFSVFSTLTNQGLWDFAFPLFMGLMIAIGTMSTAEQIESQQILERTRHYEKEMAAIQERERIAQDLHDLLGQTLTMVSLKSEIAARLIDADPDRARVEIEEIRDASRSALGDVRRVVSNMVEVSLASELQRAEHVLKSAGIQLSLTGAIPKKLSPEQDRTLGMAVREAVTNIVRHAQASRAEIEFDVVNGTLQVSIHDNGQNESAGELVEGSGIRGLRARIEELGGATTIQHDMGLRIELSIPYE